MYHMLVAEPGFEPGSSGYEPDEIPLLYSAITMYTVYQNIQKCKKTGKTTF